MYRIKHCKTQRERDLHVIEGLVRRFGALSQVEIHELTHLQRSGISGLVRDLVKQGRLVEAGRSDNSIGRKQVLLRVNEEHGFFLELGLTMKPCWQRSWIFVRESARWRGRPRDWKEVRTGWRISFSLARTKP
jgi:hypothetical protein